MRILTLATLVALPVAIYLTPELRRSEPGFRWRLILLAVSALPPLLLAAVCWNDSD